jgi:5-oxopent-3-ene-1,2,5-tricarboxylate decarboxylase / 2-hydroxyhepta-2,4-diene-1,7-dioate isomerase
MNVLEGPRKEIRRVIFGGTHYWASFEGDHLVLPDRREVALEEVVYLPPCNPTKIICIHLNYRSRADEFNRPYDEPPTYFMKPITALGAHQGELVRPEGCRYLNYEGELAAVIGRITKNVTPEEVWDNLLGFMPANDVGLQDLRTTDAGSMLRTKGLDGYCPVGPGLTSGYDVRQSVLKTTKNGRVVQEAPLTEMLFGIDYIVADLARHITLLPGDVIMTGTPANSRPMEVGDVIEVEITGLGQITNRVVATPTPRFKQGAQPQDNAEVRRISLGNDARVNPALRD